MTQFMVDIKLPSNPDADFFSLIPSQRDHIDKLLERGVVLGYSLAIDRSRLWMTLNAQDQREAVEILTSFPMFSYFEPTIYPLAFHNTSLVSILKVSLN
jgi:muconolactone delta-isomerase